MRDQNVQSKRRLITFPLNQTQSNERFFILPAAADSSSSESADPPAPPAAAAVSLGFLVGLSLHLEDPSEIVLGRMVCAELQEASRAAAIPASYYPDLPDVLSKELDGDLKGELVVSNPPSVGYLLFHIPARELVGSRPGPSKVNIAGSFSAESDGATTTTDSTNLINLNKTVTSSMTNYNNIPSRSRIDFLAESIIGIKPYILFHIRSSKSAMYTRMRTRVQKMERIVGESMAD